MDFVEKAPQCLCPARHVSPAMWICSQHTPNMSKRYWAQICGCSVNIVHPSVEVTKRPEQNSGWCGLWSATILDRLFHPWDDHHPPQDDDDRPWNQPTSWESCGFLVTVTCVCACTCVCTTTLSLAVIWIVQNGSKFDPYRPPGFQQPSPLQHMLVHNIESAFLNIFKLAS